MSYVSEMNKNQNAMNILINQLMDSKKIKFDEKNMNLEFFYYYFNGILFPFDIEFKNIQCKSFVITWKFDYNQYDIDKNKMKFIIELKKENENENFSQIYEGDKTTFLVEGLIPETNYEIRICSKYNDFKSQWTDIQKVKTTSNIIDFDNYSLILENNKEHEKILSNWINPDKNIKAELLYRLTRDGELYKTFHEKCDNKGPTLVLIHDTTNIKTGGYTPLSWESFTKWKKDNDTFIFNLTNKKKFGKPNKNRTASIHCNSTYGPWFDNFGFDYGHNMKECKFQIGNAYLNANGIIQNENKDKYFKVKEVEVYKISFA